MHVADILYEHITNCDISLSVLNAVVYVSDECKENVASVLYLVTE